MYKSMERQDNDGTNFENKVNCMLLLSHTYLIVLFILCRIPIMVGVNFCSILLYVQNFYWIRTNSKVFYILCYVEVLAHMVAAVLCVGWSGGFQMYAFALLLAIYYCNYRSMKHRGPQIHSEVCSVILGVSYLLLYVGISKNKPVYQLSISTLQMMYLVNALIILVFMVVFMETYKRIIAQSEGRLERAANQDELTQMENRRCMQRRLDILAKNPGFFNVSVAILDIDDFKKINDTYGHGAGDLVLHEVAAHIRAEQTEELYTCRWGGEEFLMVSVGEQAYPMLAAAVERIVAAVRADIHSCGGKEIAVTISAGAAAWKESETVEHTISRADAALYRAKETGKNHMEAAL